MMRLGVAPFAVVRLGAGSPWTWEASQLPSAWWIRVPNEIPFEANATLVPGGAVFRAVWRSAVICRASISMKPEPFIPIVFLSLKALSIVAKLPSSSTAPLVGLVSI